MIRLVVDSAMAVWMTAASVWMIGGLNTGREVVGFVVTCLFAGMLIAQAVGAWEAIKGGVSQGKRAVGGTPEGSPRPVDTGVWTRGDNRLVVTWDGVDYRATYWLGDESGPTATWEADDLNDLLLDREARGWRPADDLGTRCIRADLDLPGWHRFAEENY